MALRNPVAYTPTHVNIEKKYIQQYVRNTPARFDKHTSDKSKIPYKLKVCLAVRHEMEKLLRTVLIQDS